MELQFAFQPEVQGDCNSSSLLATLKEHMLQTQLVKELGRQILQPEMPEFRQSFLVVYLSWGIVKSEVLGL